MTGSLDARKKAARAVGREALRRVGAADAAALSARIGALLIASDALAGVRTVMGFAAIAGEPDLAGALAHWARAGVRVALPRTDWDGGSMEAVVVEDLGADLVEGPHGVREPREGLAVVDPGEVEAVLVPGVAFDVSGGRVGRGAGFYDRFLARVGERARAPARIVGVCYSVQVVEEVPMGDHDRRVGWVATEDGVAACAGREGGER